MYWCRTQGWHQPWWVTVSQWQCSLWLYPLVTSSSLEVILYSRVRIEQLQVSWVSTSDGCNSHRARISGSLRPIMNKKGAIQRHTQQAQMRVTRYSVLLITARCTALTMKTKWVLPLLHTVLNILKSGTHLLWECLVEEIREHVTKKKGVQLALSLNT